MDAFLKLHFCMRWQVSAHVQLFGHCIISSFRCTNRRNVRSLRVNKYAFISRGNSKVTRNNNNLISKNGSSHANKTKSIQKLSETKTTKRKRKNDYDASHDLRKVNKHSFNDQSLLKQFIFILILIWSKGNKIFVLYASNSNIFTLKYRYVIKQASHALYISILWIQKYI